MCASIIHRRSACMQLTVTLIFFIFYSLYIIRTISTVKLNRNATRASTFYSSETIDCYRFGEIYCCTRRWDPRALTVDSYRPLLLPQLAFWRLTGKPLKNRIALFHPSRIGLSFSPIALLHARKSNNNREVAGNSISVNHPRVLKLEESSYYLWNVSRNVSWVSVVRQSIIEFLSLEREDDLLLFVLRIYVNPPLCRVDLPINQEYD